MKKMSMKNWISLLLKITLAAVVAIFLGSESLIFFGFVFPAEKWYLAYTGLGLTMGTAFVYLWLLLKDADSSLKRVIALIMVVIGIVGELATAGFGMQVEAWAKIGYTMNTEDIDLMILVIRGLMLVQGLALLAYFAGDAVVEMFRDEDGDGIPNALDRDYKGKNQKPIQNMPRVILANANAADVEQVKLQEPENPQNPPRH